MAGSGTLLMNAIVKFFSFLLYSGYARLCAGPHLKVRSAQNNKIDDVEEEEDSNNNKLYYIIEFFVISLATFTLHPNIH